MNWKVTAAGLGATAVAGWLGLTVPAPPTDQVRAPARRANTASPAATTSDISEQAVRLQARLRAERAYREPSRNPFRFGAAPAVSSPVQRSVSPPAVVDAPLVPPPSAPPVVKLSGVATDTVDGVSRRTAILSTAQGIVFVREGDAVGAEYRVQAVDDGAVELITNDGTMRRLTLTSP